MKTHHESYNLNSSVKERVVITEKNLLDIQKPNFNVNDIKNEKERDLAKEVHSKINHYDLIAKILTRYRRIAFQKYTNNDVRITIDFDLEVGCSTFDFNKNYEKLKENTRKLNCAKFPFAVVEIKLKTGMENPQWIQDMIDTGLLINKHKFSKFLSGVAIYNEDYITKNGNEYETKLPYWYNDTEFQKYRNNNLFLYDDNNKSIVDNNMLNN